MNKFLLVMCLLLLSSTAHAQSYSPWRYQSATTCSTTTGIAQDLCKQTSNNTLYFCSGLSGCPGSGWVQVGGSSQTYPSAGIMVSTGSAFGSSISGTSSQFVKGDGSLDSNSYLTTASATSTYVPYSGATGNINIGPHNLLINGGTSSGDSLDVNGTINANYFQVTTFGEIVDNNGNGTLHTLNLNNVTASTPAIFDSGKNLVSGSYTGTTTEITTASGTLTNGALTAWNSSGNLVSEPLILGTLTGGDVCTYTSSGTLLVCNTAGTISGVALGSNLNALTATDTTLTFSGSYNGSASRTVGLNLGNANTWAALQKMTNGDFALLGSSTGYNLLETNNASGTNYTTTFPANTGTVAELNLAETFTAAQTINGSDLLLNNPANTFAYTIVPAAITAARNLNLPLIVGTDTLATLGLAQTWALAQTFTTAPIISSATASTIAGYDSSKDLISVATSSYPSYGLPRILRGTFTNSTLSAGVLTITHSWALSAPYTVDVTISDNGGSRIIAPTTFSTNSVAIDLSAEGSISGTWGYEVIG